MKRRTPLRRRTPMPRSRPDPTWPAARRAALERDWYSCVICGEPADEVHHRVPRQMGGRNDDPDRHALSRLISVCRAHHDRYERNRTAGYRLGILVPAGMDARWWPLHYRHRWVLLTDDGRVVLTAAPPPPAL